MKIHNRTICCVETKLFGVGTTPVDAGGHPWFNTLKEAQAYPVPSHIETPWHIYSINLMMDYSHMKEST